MDDKLNIVDQVALFLEQNKRSVQYGIYSAGLLGVVIAVRSVRPFQKFSSPQSIPKSFIQKHIRLRGHVVSVEPPGTLLVDHFPIWKLPRGSTPPLPVQIDGVNVLGLGTAWLQTVVCGQNVNFQPITAKEDAVTCIVTYGPKNKNVGTQIVSLGFATVQPIHLDKRLGKDKLYLNYYKALLAAEDIAEKERKGVWEDGKPRSKVKFHVAKTVLEMLQDKIQSVRHMRIW